MKLIGVKNNIQVLLVPNYRDLRYVHRFETPGNLKQANLHLTYFPQL